MHKWTAHFVQILIQRLPKTPKPHTKSLSHIAILLYHLQHIAIILYHLQHILELCTLRLGKSNTPTNEPFYWSSNIKNSLWTIYYTSQCSSLVIKFLHSLEEKVKWSSNWTHSSHFNIFHYDWNIHKPFLLLSGTQSHTFNKFVVTKCPAVCLKKCILTAFCINYSHQWPYI
jgi:hypothetical protein